MSNALRNIRARIMTARFLILLAVLGWNQRYIEVDLLALVLLGRGVTKSSSSSVSISCIARRVQELDAPLVVPPPALIHAKTEDTAPDTASAISSTGRSGITT